MHPIRHCNYLMYFHLETVYQLLCCIHQYLQHLKHKHQQLCFAQQLCFHQVRYNLVQYFFELGQNVEVFRNDQISIEEIETKSPDFLVISPGPCTPKEAGISVAAVSYFAGKIPILGVCLGHQSIGAAYGAEIISAKKIMHGKLLSRFKNSKYFVIAAFAKA